VSEKKIVAMRSLSSSNEDDEAFIVENCRGACSLGERVVEVFDDRINDEENEPSDISKTENLSKDDKKIIEHNICPKRKDEILDSCKTNGDVITNHIAIDKASHTDLNNINDDPGEKDPSTNFSLPGMLPVCIASLAVAIPITVYLVTRKS